MTEPSPPPATNRVGNLVLKVAGSAVAIWAAVLLAIYGALMTPFRIGTVLAPVSIVLAIGGNAGIIWFAYRVTRNKFLGLLPGIVWTAITLIASGRTGEGDLILYQSNLVATIYLYAGCATVGVAGYRLIVPKPPPPIRPPAADTRESPVPARKEPTPNRGPVPVPAAKAQPGPKKKAAPARPAARGKRRGR